MYTSVKRRIMHMKVIDSEVHKEVSVFVQNVTCWRNDSIL